MLEKLKVLIWLRWKIILTNKSILLQILLPVAFIFLYKYLGTVDTYSNRQGQDEGIFMICLIFSFILAVGSPITTILSEEKEKNNLKTLLISGIKDYEYVISTLFFPILITIIIMVITPLILNFKIISIFQYMFVVFFTALSIILIYLFLGISAKNQVNGQIMSLFAMLIIMFLPLLASLNSFIEKITDYSFLGLFYTLFINEGHISVHKSVSQVISLGVWIMILLILNTLSLKRVKKI